MTRKSNKKKYERILERLAKGEKQTSIVIAEKCSYGTISAAKQWDKNGRPATITTTRNKSTNRTKIVLSVPNFWLEYLNENIMSGIWNDYSDAIIDVIRFFYRTRMEPHTHTQIETPRGGRGPTTLRKDIMKELKENITPDQIRDFVYKNSINARELKEYKGIKEVQKQEFYKQKDLIYSRFKDLETGNYAFNDYHGISLIKEEFEVLMALEQQVGRIPKWDVDFTRGDYISTSTDLKTHKFSYTLLGKHVIMLYLCGKGLKYLPESIDQLKFLQILNLGNNNLTELPESIGNLKFLEELILHDNALISVPKSIGNLKNLGVLHLDSNDLTTLPETICNLITWYPIGLSNNKIATLSEKILKYLRYTNNLVGNPIMELFQEQAAENRPRWAKKQKNNI